MGALDAGLPPRQAFFAPLPMAEPTLSHDGAQLAYVAPSPDGLPQLVIRAVERGAERVVSGPAQGLAWSDDNTVLLFHRGGHLFAFTLASASLRELTPWPQASARLLTLAPKGQVLVVTNRRDKRAPDVWRIDLKDGSASLEVKNPGEVAEWFVDATAAVRGALSVLGDGSSVLKVRDTTRSPFRTIISAGPEETLRPVGFTLDGLGLVLVTSIAHPSERLVEKSLRTGAERSLLSSPSSEIAQTLWHPARATVQAAAVVVDGRLQWSSFESALKDDFEVLELNGRSVQVVSRDDADQTWVVALDVPGSPPTLALFRTASRTLTELTSMAPRLAGAPLAVPHTVAITTTDKRVLSGVLTRASTPGALVVWAADARQSQARVDFDAQAQWLASRGVSVLRVNHRAQWRLPKPMRSGASLKAATQDLVDAAQWAISEQLVEPSRVGIFGEGAARWLALSSPAKVFACGAVTGEGEPGALPSADALRIRHMISLMFPPAVTAGLSRVASDAATMLAVDGTEGSLGHVEARFTQCLSLKK